MTQPPSRAFGCAGVLGLVAALPGLAYVAFHLVESARSATDVLLLLGIGAVGPGLVLLGAARMMRRPERPVMLFVVSLGLTSVPTLLLMGLATFGPDNGGLVVGCLVALLSAVAAAGVAIVAAIRKRIASSEAASTP